MPSARPQFALSSLVFVLLLATLCAVRFYANGQPVHLHEKACRLSFEETKTKASLALENTPGRVPEVASFPSNFVHVLEQRRNPQRQFYLTTTILKRVPSWLRHGL